MISVEPRIVLMGGMSEDAVAEMRPGWQNCSISDDFEVHVQALKGLVTRPKEQLRWGKTNLGIGLYRARIEGKELLPELESSPPIDLVEAGKHLLVVCERGDELAEVLASNLAFACNASFAVFPGLPKVQREDWIEDLYALGEGGDQTGRFTDIAQRALDYLGPLDFKHYKAVLFVTAGFPWGITVPEVSTTHMYRYPDFGRAIIQGTWVSQSALRSARTALLVDPHTVEGSEIPSINKALIANRTLTRVVTGKAATINRVQALFDLLPHDIIVFSTHAGDSGGERITYEFDDMDGRRRTLIIDQAVGFAFDPISQKFQVTEYNHFHSLDGVDWRDDEGKDALPVGTAIDTWIAMGRPLERNACIVRREEIFRVKGSMALKLHDGVWLYAAQAFSPEAAPIIVNNSCWSWHELSQRTTFAGARAYVGSLFPITDAEAQEIGQGLFGKYINHELPKALWLSQQQTYGSSKRRPYVMVGLPFVSIRTNTADSVAFMNETYQIGIKRLLRRAKESQHDDARHNASYFATFLERDFANFQQRFLKQRPKARVK